MIFRNMIVMLAVPALAMMASCTEKQGEATDGNTMASETTTVSTNVANSPDGLSLPDMVPLYPGATVKSHIVARSTEDDAGGAAVVLSSPDSVDKVIAFYDANAKKQKATTTMTIGTGDGAMRVYSDKDDNTAMVSISKGDEATEIVITIRNNTPAG